jgi:hypothetical protein
MFLNGRLYRWRLIVTSGGKYRRHDWVRTL